MWTRSRAVCKDALEHAPVPRFAGLIHRGMSANAEITTRFERRGTATEAQADYPQRPAEHWEHPVMASPEQESESKHLLGMIDSIPSLIHTARPDGYLDYFNQRWLQYVGLPIEDLLGWKWTAVIHQEDVDAIVDRWRLSLANGEPFLHEARVRRADGEYRWMLHHKVAVRDEFGQIVRWYGSSIDIEDRKQAEEQLRRSAQELQRSAFYLAEAQRLGHIGGWVFDPTKGFDYWSNELFQIYGLDPAAGAPTSEQYLALVHPQDRESMASLMKRISRDVSGFDVTKRIVRPNGEVRYVRCVGSPPSDDGMAKRIGIGIDVTEHELLTQELRRREAYLAEAQRLSHTGSFGWKPDSGEIVWSDETYRIFEYDHTVKPSRRALGLHHELRGFASRLSSCNG
jgi:PAS domain S-box-containing protein